MGNSDTEHADDSGDGWPLWAKVLVGFVVAVVAVVILVVGVAVLGTFVLGGGSDQPATGPETTISMSQEAAGNGSTTVVFEHLEGETLEGERTSITVNGETRRDGLDGPLTTGEQVTVTDVSAGDTVTLRYQTDDGDVILGRYVVE